MDKAILLDFLMCPDQGSNTASNWGGLIGQVKDYSTPGGYFFLPFPTIKIDIWINQCRSNDFIRRR